MNSDKLVLEAVRYFKEEPGFSRLFREFIKKYESFGRLGGEVKLQHLTDAEQAALSKYFGKDYTRKKSATIAMVDFAERLSATRFDSVHFKSILDGYVGGSVLSNKEKAEREATQKSKLLQAYIDMYPHVYPRAYINARTKVFTQQYNNNPQFATHLQTICHALSHLPAGPTRIALFASKITGDPHAFDRETELWSLFIDALQVISGERIATKNAEEEASFLYKFRLLREDVLNAVACIHILAKDHNGNDILSWASSSQEGVIKNATLREMARGYSYFPASGNKVYVVENPTVFSTLLDMLPPEVTIPMICTSGQFKLAAWILLDSLVANGATLYYSGDFDPEGILLCDKLIRRYGSSVVPWHFSANDFHKACSQKSISSTRLASLQSVISPRLEEVKSALIRHPYAGYQELLLDDMFLDLQGKTTSARKTQTE